VMTMSAPATPPAPAPMSLGATARASLLWGGGFTLLRDVAQFAVMLVLVRLLTPADYGTAALVQSILAVISVASLNTFSAPTLQFGDRDKSVWRAHVAAAAVLNVALAAVVVLLAFGLSFEPHYADAALPLATLAVVFLIEIPGTLRHRMLEATHNWQRF